MRRSLMFRQVIFVALLVLPVAAQRAPVAAPRPVATVKQRHDILITPAADAVFRASAEAPTTSKAWLEVHDQALMLAESGHRLMLGDRARDRDQGMKMSSALVDEAVAAAN